MIGRVIRRLRSWRAGKSLILMYHRIDDSPVDPWGLCVSPKVFAAQMEVLADLKIACPLAEVQRKRGVAVTFDDGYADNLYAGKPVLERFGIPATVFIVTGAAGSKRFWWDELEEILLHTLNLPVDPLILQPGSQNLSWQLDVEDAKWPAGQAAKYGTWIAWRDEPPTSRHRVFRAAWEALRGLDHAMRAEQIRAVRNWAGTPASGSGIRPMDRSELRTLAAGGLVELGGHSVTHSRLSELPGETQRSEIFESKAWLDSVTGKDTTSFSFPFGGATDYDGETLRHLRSAGFRRACTTAGTAVSLLNDPYQLPRVHVQNLEADQFRAWLLRQLA